MTKTFPNRLKNTLPKSGKRIVWSIGLIVPLQPCVPAWLLPEANWSRTRFRLQAPRIPLKKPSPRSLTLKPRSMPGLMNLWAWNRKRSPWSTGFLTLISKIFWSGAIFSWKNGKIFLKNWIILCNGFLNFTERVYLLLPRQTATF